MWGEVVEWPGRVRYVPAVRPVEPSSSPASTLLRAWMLWDRACVAMVTEDPETGRRPYPSRLTMAGQAVELEAAVGAFARWAGVSSTTVRETMAAVRRFVLVRAPWMDERLANRWALAVVAGHS